MTSPRSSLSATSDQQLVALAKEGREDAYREIVDRLQRPVLQLIYGKVQNRQVAEELTQDTFLEAIDSLDDYDPRFKLSTWVLSIARHLTGSYFRGKDPTPLPLDDGPAVTPPSGEVQAAPIQIADPSASPRTPPEEEAALRAALEQAIAQLDEKYREIARLRFLQALPYEHIAEIVGLPFGTVATRVHRAKKQLTKVLGPLRDSRPPDSNPPPA